MIPFVAAVVLASLGSAPVDERADLVARVTARIGSDDPKEAAWGAFEARTLALDECSEAILARMRATQVEADDAGRTRVLQLGLMDALIAFDVSLAPDDARAFHARAPWPTLLMVARHPDGHAPLLRDIVDRTAHLDPFATWLAPRMILVETRDAEYAASLLRERTAELRVTLVDPPRPKTGGRRTFRCGGTHSHRMAHERGPSVFVPRDYPPTARWDPATNGGAGDVVLARTMSTSLHLRRRVSKPETGGGAMIGGTRRDPARYEREFLLTLANGPKGVEAALDGLRKRVEWDGPDALNADLEEWSEELDGWRTTLVRSVARAVGVTSKSLDDALPPERVVVDRRSMPRAALALPEGWTREKPER